MICVDLELLNKYWNILIKISDYFDYNYNTKYDLMTFNNCLINDLEINFYAIFCPGYTTDGYKNRIGNNNTTRIQQLSYLKDLLIEYQIRSKFHLYLADIFLENVNDKLNPNWRKELEIHREKFMEVANSFFSAIEIDLLSNIFVTDEFEKGFIDEKLLSGKVYNNFYKNNLDFYKLMQWSDEEILNRNDKLYTLYSIISNYILNEENGIYLPMENMYFRTKIMTLNDVCSMYLYK